MPYTTGKCLLGDILRAKGLEHKYITDRLPTISRQDVSDYINGASRMSIVTAKNIASLLEVTIDDLYEWKHTPGKRRERG